MNSNKRVLCYSQAYQNDDRLCSSCGIELSQDDQLLYSDSSFSVCGHDLHLCAECHAEYEQEFGEAESLTA